MHIVINHTSCAVQMNGAMGEWSGREIFTLMTAPAPDLISHGAGT